MDPERKEIVHEATHRAKAAVTEARDKVHQSLAELSTIQEQLDKARAQDAQPDRAEIDALEKRLQLIRLEMTGSVEEAGQEVRQATQEAKGKLGIAGQEEEPQRKAIDAPQAPRPRPSPHVEEDDGSSDSTPTSARASQGIVGGFLFKAPTATAEGDDEEEEEEEEEEDPTDDDVTASIDEATESAHQASEGNRRTVERAASNVKESIKDQ